MNFKTDREAFFAIRHAMDTGYHEVAKIWLRKSMKQFGWTSAQIATRLGIPGDTFRKYLQS